MSGRTSATGESPTPLPEPHTGAGGEQQLREQLATLQQQYELKQQEVVLLQAQAERLSSILESSSDGQTPTSSSSNSSDAVLQQQLDAAHAELQHTRALLDRLMQESSAAIKAACDQRSGALRLLLADQVRELREAEQQKLAAQQLAAAKEEDFEAMRAALAAANAHILVLTAQQEQPQHQPTPQPSCGCRQAQLAPPCSGTAAAAADAQALLAGSSSSSSSASSSAAGACSHSGQVKELQVQLALQRQQLEAAQEQLKELMQHMAVKADRAQFAERRAALLEQQLEDARQQLADAVAAAVAAAAAAAALTASPPKPQQQRRRSCSSIAEADDDASDASPTGAPLVGLHIPPAAQSPQPGSHHQQHEQQQQQHNKPMGLAGSLTAALSNAASATAERFSLAGPGRGEEHEQPPRQQTPPPLSPFALARKFVADREADAITRLKDELCEREQEVSGLSAANARLEDQLSGLQTLLVSKVSHCSRLDKEVKEASRQLRQAEAAAAADQGVLGQQIGQLSERVAELQEALGEAQQREQQLQAQLAATRAKLAQVLDALVDDAAALQQHKPGHFKHLVQDMPAALADVMATAAASSTAAGAGGGVASVQHVAGAAASGSGRTSLEGHGAASRPGSMTTMPASRTASLPLEGLTGLGSLWHPAGLQGAPQPGSINSLQQDGDASASSSSAAAARGAWAGAADPKHPFGLRSFMRSRTLSSNDGGACSGKAGPAAGGQPEGMSQWGRCVSASVHVQPQKPAGSFTGLQAVTASTGGAGAGAGAGAAAAGSAAATPKQSAAAKLFEVFRKKGRELEEAEVEAAAVVAHSGRTTGSGEFGYVLLES